jgi:hypothetical protein
MTDDKIDAIWSSLDLSDIAAPLSVDGQAEVRRRFALLIERAAREAVLKEITEAFHASVVAALREGS